MEASPSPESSVRRPRLSAVGVGPGVLKRLQHPALDADLIPDADGSPVDVLVLGSAQLGALPQWRHLRPRAAIVAMTDHKVSEAEAVALYDAGADAVVPSRPADVFVAHLRAVLRRAAWRAMS